MKTILLAAGLVMGGISSTALAQNEVKPSVNIDFNTRFDFNHSKTEGAPHTSGFKGKYFNLMISGNINEHFSYNIRQRLNKPIDKNEDEKFNATDWAYVTYMPNSNWAFSGGKQVVAIGGYEYDAAPIDVYYSSMFWNNIACYAFGVSGKYISNSGLHSLLFQVCNSPAQGLDSNTYAYNLFWQGKTGVWSTLWSANLIETTPGHFAEYLALGNRFDFTGFNLELDLMQRSYEGHAFWLDDYSVIAKAEVALSSSFNLVVKGGYEVFHPERMQPATAGVGDLTVKKPFYGVGLEAFPLKNSRNLRLHAFWDINHGGDGPRTQQFLAGLTWRANLLKWTK